MDVTKLLPLSITNHVLCSKNLDYDPFSISNLQNKFPNMENDMANAVRTASKRQYLRNKIKQELSLYFYGLYINGECESK